MRPKVNAPWRIADGLALVAELAALSNPIEPNQEGWEEIQIASKRTGLRVGAIIAAIRKNELRISCQNGVFGYKSFMVLKSEINHLADESPHIRRRSETPPEGQPASAFARSIGMRSEGWFADLFRAGHVSARWAHHPALNRELLYVTGTDIAAFHRRFLTPALMQGEFGLHRNTCIARLRDAGVPPFAPDGRSFGALYERKDVEPVLRPADE